MQVGAPGVSALRLSVAAGQQLHSGKNAFHPRLLHSTRTDCCLLLTFDIGHPFWMTIRTIFAAAPAAWPTA
jgi:hypothetical protein